MYGTSATALDCRGARFFKQTIAALSKIIAAGTGSRRSGKTTIACACVQCGASLRARVTEGWVLPYALITGSVAAILAFTVVLSGDFVTTVALLLAWTLVSWAAYPVVLSLQIESK